MPHNPKKNGKARIGWLIFFHIVGLLAFRMLFSFDSPPRSSFLWIVPFFAVLIAQSGLVGVYAALSLASREERIALTSVAIVWFLGSTFGEILFRDGESFVYSVMVVSVPTLANCFGIMVTVGRSAVLRPVATDSSRQLTDGLTFSIRHVLIATTVIAALITLGKIVRSFYEWLPGGDRWEFLAILLFIVIVSVGYLTSTIVNLWACLSTVVPTVRLMLTFGLGLCLTGLGMFYFPFDTEGAIVFGTTMTLQIGVVTISLLVVRSAGYRLFQREPASSDENARRIVFQDGDLSN